MSDKQSLTARQKLFAHRLALGASEAEAAADAGLSDAETLRARRALAHGEGAEYLRELQAAVEGRGCRSARDGYYKLAFGDVSDALALILSGDGEEFSLPARTPDLFNVSEIRRGKNGIELRFFDRLEALDRLAQLENAQSGGSFYDALLRSAVPSAGEEENGD